MTVSYLGSLTVGGALPGVSAGVTAGVAGIDAALPDLVSRLAALQSFAPSPVSFTAQLGTAKLLVGSLEKAIALGLPAPSIAAQIAAVTALVTDLLASVNAVNAQLSILHTLQTRLAAAGVHALAFGGAAGALGAELETAVGALPGVAPGDDAHALVLFTTTPATWAALAALAGVSP